MHETTRKHFVSLLALFGILVSFPACAALADNPAAVDRPNIVYFMIDELGYYELSLMGHPEFRTPNIDRLAAEGTRFTQFLAGSSVCAPTRCTFLTGKHTGHCTVRPKARKARSPGNKERKAR